LGGIIDVGPQARTLACCCLGQFMVILDVTIVNVALPSIRADLGFTASGLPWVVTAYTVAFAGFLLLGGRASDLLGRRTVFTVGLGTFAVASLAGGLAPSAGLLVGARAVQGVGAAVVAPASLAILATTFPEGRPRNRALGLWGAMGGVGGATGALFGGLLVDTLSWRWILLVNAPIGLCVALAARSISADSPGLRGAIRSFDVRGALTVTAGLTLLTYGVVSSGGHGWWAGSTLAPLGAGVALIAFFLLIEGWWAAAPLVPLRVFGSPALAGANAVVFCMGATVFSMWFLTTLYLQQVLGLSPLETGLAFLPMSLTIMTSSRLASGLVARFGAGGVLVAGMASLGAGMLLFSRIGAHGSWPADVAVPSLLCAAGIGASFIPATIAANAGVAAGEAGLASGLLVSCNQVGGSIGLALLATIAASRTGSVGRHAAPAVALTEGFRAAYLTGGCVALAGSAVAFLVVRRHTSVDRTQPTFLDDPSPVPVENG
jgi:EmrB/QacA subfamily drug resistance transporter